MKGFLRFSNSKKNKSWHEAEHYSVGCIGFLAFLTLFLWGGGRGDFFGILRLKSSYLYLFGIQIALAWGIKRNTPVLPKAVSENHIKENLEALHVNLDEDDMKAIENIGIRHRYLMQAWMFKPEEVPENYWDGEE